MRFGAAWLGRRELTARSVMVASPISQKNEGLARDIFKAHAPHSDSTSGTIPRAIWAAPGGAADIFCSHHHDFAIGKKAGFFWVRLRFFLSAVRPHAAYPFMEAAHTDPARDKCA